MLSFKEFLLHLNILIGINFLPCQAGIISIENIGLKDVHFSYVGNLGKPTGLMVSKGISNVSTNHALIVTFDYLQELYPFLLFPGDTIKVQLNSSGKFEFFKKNIIQNEVLVHLESKFHFFKSPMFGIEYNSKVDYNAILEESRNRFKNHCKFIRNVAMSEDFRRIYYELSYAVFVDELQAPFFKLGYSTKVLPTFYAKEVESGVDSLFQLTKISRNPKLLRQYLLSCVRTKLRAQSHEENFEQICYNYINQYINPSLKDFVQVQLLRDAISRGRNTDNMVNQFLKSTNDNLYKVYFGGLKSLSTSLSKNNEHIVSFYQDSITWTELLKQRSGRLIYIDVWASWCAPCHSEMPHSISLEKKLTGKGISFLYLSIDDDDFKWQKSIKIYFGDSGKVNHYRMAPTSQIASLLTQGSVPKYLIVGKDGKIITSNTSRPSQTETLSTLLDLSKSD